jgi:hypothetical protein
MNISKKAQELLGPTQSMVAGLIIFASSMVNAGTIAFSSGTYSTNEITSTAVLTLTRAGVVTSAASVVMTTSNGSATAGSDYTAVSLTVSWAAGDASNKTVSVPVLDDRLAEGPETVTATLSAVVGDTLAAPSTAVLTIVDYEEGTLQFQAANYEVSEAAGTISIPVLRSGGSNGAVSIAYTTSNGTAIAPNFYSTTTGVLGFDDGVSTKNVVVPIVNNSVGQVDKDFRITLSTVTGGAVLGTLTTTVVTILNDDADFTPGLTKITPSKPGVIQPAVLALTQPSPFLSTQTLLATINRIPEFIVTGLSLAQAPTGIVSVVNGASTYTFLPYSATRVASGTRQGVFFNADMSGYMITDEHLMISFQPAIASIEVLQAFLISLQMPKVEITEHGNILVQRMQGPAPLAVASDGQLFIVNNYFDRFLLRPSIVTTSAPSGRAAGAYILPHPLNHASLKDKVVLQLIFEDGTQRRQQILVTAPLIASEFLTSLQSLPGVSDVRFADAGIITFRFNGRLVTLYADIEIRRIDPASYSGMSRPRGLQNTEDVNRDGSSDFRMLYSSGDEQYFFVIP